MNSSMKKKIIKLLNDLNEEELKDVLEYLYSRAVHGDMSTDLIRVSVTKESSFKQII